MTMGLLAVSGAADSFATPTRQRRLPAAEWLVAEALLLLVALAAAATDHDFAASVAHFMAAAAGHLRQAPWELTPVLLLLAGLHYLAAALALRTAADLPLPIRQTFKVQLAAAAANRVTPAGLGAVAVNTRFLMRRGRQDGTQAISVISTLGVLGAVADALVFLLVVVVGSWFGMHGAAHELGALTHKLTAPVVAGWHLLGWTGLLGVVAAAVLLAVGLRAWRLRRPGAAARAEKVSCFLRRLRHDFGVQFGTLGPAGVGATEAALAGILMSGGMPAAIAISSVIFFRLVTFWAPALAGVWAVRGLRREAAI